MRSIIDHIGRLVFDLVRLGIVIQIAFFMIREVDRGHFMQATIFVALLLLIAQPDFDKETKRRKDDDLARLGDT